MIFQKRGHDIYEVSILNAFIDTVISLNWRLATIHSCIIYEIANSVTYSTDLVANLSVIWPTTNRLSSHMYTSE